MHDTGIVVSTIKQVCLRWMEYSEVSIKRWVPYVFKNNFNMFISIGAGVFVKKTNGMSKLVDYGWKINTAWSPK